ncbi:MAG: addiction module toxin RelE [Gammaproteobacteria bacterium]|nr:addiction module toxin RelE [Gammaproteobacteria bacterium]
MARPLRIEYAGALYHITSRGDKKSDIYQDDHDRESFLETLGEVCQRYNWILHAYCLMNNHYHLLVETPEVNLSSGMRQLNGVYTQRFNRYHNQVGHVFQGRYKAIIVQKEPYLLELARYIVLNPVRARMVRTVNNWRWSSYRATIRSAPPQARLNTDWLLSCFAKRKLTAIERYKRFVAEGKNQPSPWIQLQNQVFLGSEKFVDETRKHLPTDKDLSEIPKPQKRPTARPLTYYSKKTRSRNEAIFKAYQSGGYTMKEIGDYFDLHYSRISRIIREKEVATKDKT